MRKQLFATILIVTGAFQSGCQSPQSVRDLGAELAEASDFASRAHLSSLAHYSETLTALKEEIRALTEFAVNLEKVARERGRRALQYRHEAVAAQLLASFDEQALAVLQVAFNEQLENRYWPPIAERFRQATADRQALKASLSASNDPLITKEYREQAVHAENLLRKGYAMEVELRRLAVDEFVRVRSRLKERIRVRLASISDEFEEPVGEFPQLTATMLQEIQETIDSIERAKTEMQQVYVEKQDALEQVNGYLNRPRKWQLIFQGLRSQAINEISQYSKVIADRTDRWIRDLEKDLDSRLDTIDLSAEIGQAVESLTIALDTRIAATEAETVTAELTAVP